MGWSLSSGVYSLDRVGKLELWVKSGLVPVSVNKVQFGTQPCSSIYVWPVAAFEPQLQNSVIAAETDGLQNLKHFLSGPLWNKFAYPCPRVEFIFQAWKFFF